MTREDLIARVEGATGADDELDARILCALAAPEGAIVEKSAINGEWCIYHAPDAPGRRRLWEKRDWWRADGWPITASIDAAYALVGGVRPDAYIELSGPRKYLHIPTPVPNYWRAALWADNSSEGWGDTPALALVAALPEESADA